MKLKNRIAIGLCNFIEADGRKPSFFRHFDALSEIAVWKMDFNSENSLTPSCSALTPATRALQPRSLLFYADMEMSSMRPQTRLSGALLLRHTRARISRPFCVRRMVIEAHQQPPESAPDIDRVV